MELASFKVNRNTLKIESCKYRQYSNSFSAISSSIRSSRRIISGMNGSASILSGRLNSIEKQLEQYINFSDEMSLALENIEAKYASTEQTFENYMSEYFGNNSSESMTSEKSSDDKSFFENLWDKICSWFGWGDKTDPNPYEIDSIVFDDEGSYGGDQGSPQYAYKNRKSIYNIVRKYYPDMSDAEIKNYLIKLNDEGCAYVAFVNTIFAAYAGREDEFEDTFGFPMYKNNDLNFNELIVDFYCDTDNHNQFLWTDYVNRFEDKSDTEGSGMSTSDEIYRAGKYMREKGVDMEIRSEKITVENFKDYAENGYVIVNFHNGPLLNTDGSTAQYIDGGHAMTVTGVTSDGKYIVSSWGDEYYIDPNDGRLDFVYVTY